MTVKYIIQFDHRSDAGTRHVGPFDTREEALDWLGRQTFDNIGNLARLEAPEPTEERPEVCVPAVPAEPGLVDSSAVVDVTRDLGPAAPLLTPIGHARLVAGEVVFDPSTNDPHADFLADTPHAWTPIYAGQVTPDDDGIIPPEQLRALIGARTGS